MYVLLKEWMAKVSENLVVLNKDYIVSKGTSGSWAYRKWNSGKVEAWCKANVTASATTAANNVFRSSYSLSIPSGIFDSTPTINISFNQTATTVFGLNGYASSKTAISGNIFRSNANSSTYTVSVSVYAWTN